MKRKLVKQGAATMMISLPAKWIKKLHLKKGDEIDLNESGNSLIISKEAKSSKKQTTIEITNENRKDIVPILTHIYRRGFDIIKINEIDSNLLKQIKEIVNDLLLGFEITEIEDTRCKIENVSEPAEQKYESLLRRIFLLIKETQSIIHNDFKKNQFNKFKEVEDFKKQLDKFVIFCKRVTKNESYLKWELLTFLMHIEHAYYYLYKYASENKVIKDDNIINLLEKLQDYFELYYNAYFKTDIKSIHKINYLKNKYQFGKCLELINKGKNPVIFSYIKEIFRLIQIGTSPILTELFQEELI